MEKLVIACQTCGYLIKDIANAYIKEGYDVTLITSKVSLNGIEKGLSCKINKRTVISYDKTSPIKRLCTWSISTIQIFFEILMHHYHDKILYVSNPPFCPLLPLVLKNDFSLLIWDIYPDVLINQHVISDDNIIVRWWRKGNNNIFKKANNVFSISEGMKESLSKYVSSEKIKVIPLWPDNANLQIIRKEDNLFIKKYNLDDKFIVMYSGNMGNTHRMDVLIDVSQKIKDDDIAFVLIGEGGKKKYIERRIKEEGVHNVMLLPYQPYDFLSHSLSAADIAVVTLDSVSSKMSVPSKTFNMMLLGAPLLCIASLDSELGNIVREYHAGGIFIPENIDGIVNFICELKNDCSLKLQYSHNSQNASKRFSPDNAKLFVV